MIHDTLSIDTQITSPYLHQLLREDMEKRTFIRDVGRRVDDISTMTTTTHQVFQQGDLVFHQVNKDSFLMRTMMLEREGVLYSVVVYSVVVVVVVVVVVSDFS